MHTHTALKVPLNGTRQAGVAQRERERERAACESGGSLGRHSAPLQIDAIGSIERTRSGIVRRAGCLLYRFRIFL